MKARVGVRGRLVRTRTAGTGHAAHEYEYDSSSAGGPPLAAPVAGLGFGAELDGFANLAVVLLLALRSLSHLEPFSQIM